MSFSLERIKQIDLETKHLMTGFLRSTQEELNKDKGVDYIIPDLITYTCLLFYHIPDIFEDPPSSLKVSGLHNDTYTKIGSFWENSVYGKRWMDSKCKNIYSWNIKLNKCNPDNNNGVAIGIISNYHHQDLYKDFCAEHSYWMRVNNDEDEGGCTIAIDGGSEKSVADASKEGDTFTFIVNFEQLLLECYRNFNSNNTTVLVRNIKQKDENGKDLKYKLALCIFWDETSVTVSSNNTVWYR
eukprot:378717_1